MSIPTSPMIVPQTVLQTIDAEQAAYILANYQYHFQRTLRPLHVKALARAMRDHTFVQNTQIHLAMLGTQYMLMDGQHRLQAVIESDCPQSFDVLITPVSTAEQAAMLYGVTDTGLRRTMHDLTNAMQLAEELGITPTLLNKVESAINFLCVGLTRQHAQNKPSRSELVRAIRQYAPEITQIDGMTAGTPRGIKIAAMRAPTLAIMLLSLKFSKPVAESRGDPGVHDFWAGVIHDDGIEIGDPRKVVNRHLLTSKITNTVTIKAHTGVFTPPHSARYIAQCFNAWMERRQLTKTSVFDSQAPLEMYGVPSDPALWFEVRDAKAE